MVIHFEKKNIIAKDLFSKKYKKIVLNPKKTKGSYSRKLREKSSANSLNNFLRTFPCPF